MSTPEPIFVFGAPRSGTTLLGQLLSAHPDLAYAEEPRLVWRHGNDGKSDALTADDARPEVAQHVRDHFDRFVADAGRKRLLEKTPSNALRPAFVHAIYPRGRFIHVIRNGYDAALSIRAYTNRHATGVPRGRLLQRLREVKPSQLRHYGKEAAARLLPASIRPGWATPVWGPRLPGLVAIQREVGGLGTACLQWRACVEATCQFGRALPPGQYMELRLEDLNEERLRGVLDFCELGDAPDVLARFGEEFRVGDATARRGDAAGDDLVQIRRWIEPTMQWIDRTAPVAGQSVESSGAAS